MLDMDFDGKFLDEFLAQLTGEDGIRLQETKDACANDRVQQSDERHLAGIGG
jgi:hypothetical protein